MEVILVLPWEERELLFIWKQVPPAADTTTFLGH